MLLLKGWGYSLGAVGQGKEIKGKKELKFSLYMEMATHSSILAWKIPWTEDPVHGVAKSWTRLSDFTFTFLYKWKT